MRLYICTIFFVLFYTPHIYAACNALIKIPVGGSQSIVYDAFKGGDTEVEIPYTLSNTGKDSCDVFVQFLTDHGKPRMRGGKKNLFYDIVNASGKGSSRLGTINAVTSVTIPAQSNGITGSFKLKINGGNIVPPESYIDEITLVVTDGNNRNDRLFDSAEVNLIATVEPNIDIKMSFSNQSYDAAGSVSLVDLGVLRSGLRQNTWLILRGNASARVDIASENRGVLKNTRDGNVPGIPYEISIAGKQQSLSSNREFETTLPNNSQGKSLQMTFIVGDVDTPWGGVYQDVITITATSY